MKFGWIILSQDNDQRDSFPIA